MTESSLKHINAILTRILISISLILILSGVSGCQKSPINGNLDGMWQVMSVEPEVDNPHFDSSIYYNFNLHVVQLSIYGGVWISGNMRFEDDELWLQFPNADAPDTIDALHQYGINSNPVAFKVIHLDRKRMVLRDGDTTVTLRKF